MLILLLMSLLLFQSAFPAQSLNKKAERILDSMQYVMPIRSIIGQHEWDELQLDLLISMLDRTRTSFGRWGLTKLLQPIADKEELMQRKKIIIFLIEHEDAMRIFQEQLDRLHRVEKSLIAYWDKSDALNRSSERFYFSALGLGKLNESSIALNISTVLDAFSSVKGLLQAFALWGISEEITRWSLGVQEDLNLWRGIRSGLMDPLMRHSPYLYKLGTGPYSARDTARTVSWGDVYNISKAGFSYEKVDKTITTIPGMGSLGAFFVATIGTLFYDYQWINSVDFIFKRIVSMNHDLNQLQTRVSEVAQSIDILKKLRSLVVKHAPELTAYFDDEEYEVDEDFVKNLLSQRFLKKPNALYSRGHVLTMHLDIMRKKRLLIPLLHTIALLDAYCSIAQLYKEQENKAVQFSFPEFINSPQPFVNYQQAWLPLLPSGQEVTNNIILGQSTASKMIITGPNGSGKSTILKTFGIIPVLAQSWGIVPATSAQQPLFAAIKTNFTAHEDVSRGISRGTAGLQIMEKLTEDIHQSDDQPMLVLIDEPYSGLPDAEAANRIYKFGRNIAKHDQALVVIATHTEKPIQLAGDTDGIFSNYQVKINEVRPGVFERLFKLEPGAALWWFEDESKRGRFVDWINLKFTAKA